MKRTTAGLAGILLTASVGLTACGGSSSGSANDTGKSGSSNSSNSSDSSGSTGTTTTSYTPLTKASLPAAMASAVAQKKSAHMTMRTGSTEVTSDFDLSGSSPAMKIEMHLTEGSKQLTFHEILTGGAIYMSAPGMTPAGKYVKLDSSTPGLGQMLGSLKSLNPAKMLAAFSKNVDAVKYQGQSTIDGQSVRHYTLTMVTKDLLKSINLGAAGSMVQQQASKLPKKLSEEIYLNSDNTTRRVSFTAMNNPITVDFTDWGKPVTVTAPPKSDVVSMSNMMGSMGSSHAG